MSISSAPSSTKRAIQAAKPIFDSPGVGWVGGWVVCCGSLSSAEEDTTGTPDPKESGSPADSRTGAGKHQTRGRRQSCTRERKLRGRVTQLRPARRPPPDTCDKTARGEHGRLHGLVNRTSPQDRHRRNRKSGHCHRHLGTGTRPRYDTPGPAAHQIVDPPLSVRPANRPAGPPQNTGTRSPSQRRRRGRSTWAGLNSVAAPRVRPSPWAGHRELPGAPREEARP